MVLVFGMTITGCSDDGGGGGGGYDVNILDEMGLRAGSPSNDTLAVFGLNSTQFSTIQSIVTGYKGYVIEGDNYSLILAWTDRSQDNYNTVAAHLKSIFSATEQHGNGDNGNPLLVIGRVSEKKRYQVTVYTRKSDSSGAYFPAGTLLVEIYSQ